MDMYAKGTGGQLRFDGQYVTFEHKGFLARTTTGKGEKRLHISQISAVQWKPAGMVVNGFIQFTIPGGNEVRSSFGSQTFSAVEDENSVVFNRNQQPAFDAMRAAIDEAIARQHAAPQPTAAAAEVGGSVADELTKLGALVQQGLMSREEFEQAKARLLG
ncbi:DUF4429 domain-containing protein [Streptomyces sp. TP-A0875]|uniref:DUF4429 domain-containing protein n=1 Tax=Streptomyces sp. TP-A0875 TaxID=552354 RepID=UPI000AFA811B|nr:DUF4429 domain-containing protein [Streptomyces sp. TP-A0875]